MSRKLGHAIIIILLILPFSSSFSIDTPPAPVLEYNASSTLSQSSIIRGPTVNLVTNQSALIFWRTEGPTDATVHYGLNASLLESASNSTLDSNHRIALSDLQIGSTYWYQVRSNGTSSSVYDFKTAPADGEPFKIVVIGDNRPGMGNWDRQPWVFYQLAEMIAEERPHLVIFTADYVWEVTEVHEDNLIAWRAFTDIADSIGHYAPLYGVIGNHDDGATTGERRLEYFFDAFELVNEPSTYYSFDYAGVHFTGLDSEVWGLWGRITGDQYDWLSNDLATTSYDKKFVFSHRPLYPVSHINSALDVNKAERDRLQTLFEETNVAAYFSGHDHCYNRLTVNGVVHFIAGGGGARLYENPWGGLYHHYLKVEVSASKIDFVSIDRYGNPVDMYSLPDEGPIEIDIRPFGNESSKPAGTLPEIFFSQVPQTTYYSWDSESNATALTGLPSAVGSHTLDIYAENDEGVWSHIRYVLNSTPLVTLNTNTTTSEELPMVPIIVTGVLIGVVAVVILFVLKKRL